MFLSLLTLWSFVSAALTASSSCLVAKVAFNIAILWSVCPDDELTELSRLASHCAVISQNEYFRHS